MDTSKSNSNNHYEDIITQIENLISTGVYKEGDKFPSERTLAEQFHVSRVPIREALKILEYIGVLRNINGEGLIVSTPDISKIIGKISFVNTFAINDLASFYEVRISLEGTAAYYAAKRRTQEDINTISETIKKAKALLKSSESNQSDNDFEMLRMFSHEFHIQVVSSAHNEILNGLYKSLFNLLDYSKRYTISGDFNTFDSLLAHETILTKIRLQDSEGAKEDMIGHLESAQKKLTQEIQEYLNKKSM